MASTIPPPYLSVRLPPEDTVSLIGLSPPAVQRWTLARIEEYETIIRNLRTIHNASAPIHISLPTEVIIHIFSLIKVHSFADLAVTCVCRAWRSIVLSTPVFWANLLGVLEDVKLVPEGVLSLILQRSAPIRIGIPIRQKMGLLLDGNMLTAHLHRIFTLIVDVNLAQWDGLQDMLRHRRLPTLESLTVDLYPVQVPQLKNRLREIDRRPHIPDDALPCLRRLHIPCVLFDPLISVPSLRDLTLASELRRNRDAAGGILRIRVISVRVLFQALGRCPNLLWLRIHDILAGIPADFNIPTAQQPTPVEFPVLQELTLVESERPDLLSHFFTSISISPTASLTLICNTSHHWTLFTDLLPEQQRAATLRMLNRVCLEIEPSSFGGAVVLRGFDGDRQCLMMQPGERLYGLRSPKRYLENLEVLARSFAPGRMQAFELPYSWGPGRNGRELVPYDELRQLLHALPFLTSICFHGWSWENPVERDPMLAIGVCPVLDELVLVYPGNSVPTGPVARDVADRLAPVLEHRRSRRLKHLTLRFQAGEESNDHENGEQASKNALWNALSNRLREFTEYVLVV